MADNPLGLLFELEAGPGKAEAALESFRAKATETFQSVAEASRRAAPALGATTAELQRLAVASQTAFDQMNRHVQGWSQTATTSFARRQAVGVRPWSRRARANSNGLPSECRSEE